MDKKYLINPIKSFISFQHLMERWKYLFQSTESCSLLHYWFVFTQVYVSVYERDVLAEYWNMGQYRRVIMIGLRWNKNSDKVEISIEIARQWKGLNRTSRTLWDGLDCQLIVYSACNLRSLFLHVSQIGQNSRGDGWDELQGHIRSV